MGRVHLVRGRIRERREQAKKGFEGYLSLPSYPIVCF
jgi:hypothetical protein